MKEFFGKAVLSMAAQDGLLHGGVQQTEKIFFSGGRDVGTNGRKPCHCKGYMGLRRRGGAVQKSGGALVRADCSCEADEIMLT